MNIFGKLQQEYEQLWKYVVRPSRSPYPETMLGPPLFQLEGKKVTRTDFQLTNSRGYLFYCSHFVPADQDTYNTVIYMHGNSSNRTEGMEYLGKLIRQGISLCVFDFSGCGNAEGEYVTLGYYEQEDLHEVVTYIKGRPKVRDVAIWGRSMGAVTALLYLKKNNDIICAVVDSPFKSLKCLIEDLVRKNSKIPMLILSGALKIIAGTIQEKAKFSIYKINPLKFNVPETKQPAFFIVGLDDELIPPEHTKQLYAAYAGTQKQIRLTKGKHNDSRPDQCIDDAVAFLVRNFKKHSMVKQEKQLTPQKKKEEIDFFNDHNDHAQNQKKANDIDFFKEMEKNQEAVASIEKQEFTFANIFSNAFSQAKKLVTPKEEKKKRKDGYEETQNIIRKKMNNEYLTKMEQKKRLRRRQEAEKINSEQQTLDNAVYEKQMIQNLASWSY